MRKEMDSTYAPPELSDPAITMTLGVGILRSGALRWGWQWVSQLLGTALLIRVD